MLSRARLQAEGVRHTRGLRSLSAALLKYAFWWCALLVWQVGDSTRCIPFRAIHQIVARRCDLAGRAPVLAGAAHGTVSAPELRAPSAQHLAPCLMRSTGSERTRRRPCTRQHRACTLQRSAQSAREIDLQHNRASLLVCVRDTDIYCVRRGAHCWAARRIRSVEIAA